MPIESLEQAMEDFADIMDNLPWYSFKVYSLALAGFRVPEIADMLNSPEITARTIFHKAGKRVDEELRNKGYDNNDVLEIYGYVFDHYKSIFQN